MPPTSEEKKWYYYKHTKPCFMILSYQTCSNGKDCNYAHTLEQYLKAINKRNFQIDESIVREFENLTESQSSSKKRRII